VIARTRQERSRNVTGGGAKTLSGIFFLFCKGNQMELTARMKEQQKWLKEQNARMQLGLGDIEKIKSLNWIYFVEDGGQFSPNKMLICENDVLNSPTASWALETMLQHATAIIDPLTGQKVQRLVDQYLWCGEVGTQVDQPWLGASSAWSMFAEWGFEMMPDISYMEIRKVSSSILKRYKTAKSLRDLGLNLTAIIFLDTENLLQGALLSPSYKKITAETK
jgi:hypothetical protein